MIDESLMAEIQADEFNLIPSEPMKRFYVSITWDGWPEGGSYADVVEAVSTEAAEQMVIEAMASSRACEQDVEDDPDFCANCLTTDQDGSGVCPDCGCDKYIPGEETAVEKMIARYGDRWHVVDCWDLDGFIENHAVKK